MRHLPQKHPHRLLIAKKQLEENESKLKETLDALEALNT